MQFSSDISEYILSFLSNDDIRENRLISKSFSGTSLYKLYCIPKFIDTNKFKRLHKSLLKNVKKLIIKPYMICVPESVLYELQSVEHICFYGHSQDNTLHLTNLQKFKNLRKLTFKKCNLEVDFSKLYKNRIESLEKIKIKVSPDTDVTVKNLYENLSDFPLLKKILNDYVFCAHFYNIIKNKNIQNIDFHCGHANLESLINLNHVTDFRLSSQESSLSTILKFIKHIKKFECESYCINDYNGLKELQVLKCVKLEKNSVSKCTNLTKLCAYQPNFKNKINLQTLKKLRSLKLHIYDKITGHDLSLTSFPLLEDLNLNHVNHTVYESSPCTLDLSSLHNLKYIKLGSYFHVKTNSVTSKKILKLNIRKWTDDDPGYVFLENLKKYRFSYDGGSHQKMIKLLPKLEYINFENTSKKIFVENIKWIQSQSKLKKIKCPNDLLRLLDPLCFPKLKTIITAPAHYEFGTSNFEISPESCKFFASAREVYLYSDMSKLVVRNVPNMVIVSASTHNISIDSSNCDNLKSVRSSQNFNINCKVTGPKKYTTHTYCDSFVVNFE